MVVYIGLLVDKYVDSFFIFVACCGSIEFNDN